MVSELSSILCLSDFLGSLRLMGKAKTKLNVAYTYQVGKAKITVIERKLLSLKFCLQKGYGEEEIFVIIALISDFASSRIQVNREKTIYVRGGESKSLHFTLGYALKCHHICRVLPIFL